MSLEAAMSAITLDPNGAQGPTPFSVTTATTATTQSNVGDEEPTYAIAHSENKGVTVDSTTDVTQRKRVPEHSYRRLAASSLIPAVSAGGAITPHIPATTTPSDVDSEASNSAVADWENADVTVESSTDATRGDGAQASAGRSLPHTGTSRIAVSTATQVTSSVPTANLTTSATASLLDGEPVFRSEAEDEVNNPSVGVQASTSAVDGGRSGYLNALDPMPATMALSRRRRR
jgi:hypothetical protein